MGYTALYRKFRPLTFSDMVGQEHITQTLKNQIMSGRVGHAYLFNGGRGTGKTTSAKILARAINCINPQDGEPCNECEICKAILSESLPDVVDMDAASNNGVDDIRSIKEEVNFLPTKAKYRVYIIDEVHMLSTGAFNALLKTLEEPPEHVKFILATTEPQKLPATILSRCQRFDFGRISDENIVKRLEIVCSESKIEATKAALNLIAVLAEGAMRDALSILERCIQDGNNKIDEDKIKDLVGMPKLTYIKGLSKSIFEYNIDDALEFIGNILEEGKDLNYSLWEIIKYVKDILVFKTSGKLGIYNNDEIEDIKSLSEIISKERLINIIYELSDLENRMKISTQKSIIFEAGIIKLCNKVSTENQPPQDLITRIERIEKAIQSGITVQRSNTLSNNKMAPTSKEQSVQNKVNTNKPHSFTGTSNEYWPQIINSLKKDGKIMLYTNLLNTTAVELNEMTVGINFPNGLTQFNKSVLEKYENKQAICDLLTIACGKSMQIKFLDTAACNSAPSSEEDLEYFATGNGIPFNISE